MHVPQEIEMSISPPHGPIHEEIEFWYDPNEKALLYEVNLQREHRQHRARRPAVVPDREQ